MATQDESVRSDRRPTVLIVDDELHIIEFLRMGFSYEGFDIHVAMNGPEALRVAAAQNPDIVILDIMLPGLDGLEVARRLRTTSNTAIIMLTAKGAVDDRVAGLDMGADDYLTKPFAFRELMARVRAVLRRHGKHFDELLTFQGVTLIPDICADADRLRQVLLNIVDNALKFTPVSGRVELIASSGSGGEIVIQVLDTGVGIPTEALPHVFDRFYRADPARVRSPLQIGGNGLGLAIAKELIEMHRGKIAINSTLGAGTTVTITLPQ